MFENMSFITGKWRILACLMVAIGKIGNTNGINIITCQTSSGLYELRKQFSSNKIRFLK